MQVTFQPYAKVGVNGNQGDSVHQQSGAVYLFERLGGEWQQTNYLKASNTQGRWAQFGVALDWSADGKSLAVGATGEASASRVINGDESNISSGGSGAVYVFTRHNQNWVQQAYLKTSNGDASDNLGRGVSISGDGSTIAVSAPGERSLATGINGNQSDNSTPSAGAVYVFFQRDGNWQQQAYIKGNTSNTSDTSSGGDSFGEHAVSLSADGNTLAVGVQSNDSNATGINGNPHNNSSSSSGAC